MPSTFRRLQKHEKEQRRATKRLLKRAPQGAAPGGTDDRARREARGPGARLVTVAPRHTRWRQGSAALILVLSFCVVVMLASACEAAVGRIIDSVKAGIADCFIPVLVPDDTEHTERGGSDADLRQLGGSQPLSSRNGNPCLASAGNYHSSHLLWIRIEIVPLYEGCYSRSNYHGICISHISSNYDRCRNGYFISDRWSFNVSNPDLGSVSSEEFPRPEFNCLAREARLPVSDLDQKTGEYPDGYSGKSRDGGVVGLQKIEGARNREPHRSPLVMSAFIAVLAAIPVVGWLAARDRR
jgi:hypothetical protein